MTVVDDSPTPPTIMVKSVKSITIGADGKLHVELTTDSEEELSSVPVWGALGFDPERGDWDWLDEPIGYVEIDEDGNTTFDLSITAESLIISIGKPSYRP